MENSRIPNKLKKFRSAVGYSQKKVAALLGLKDTSVISRWEHGITSPNMRQLFYLSRIYQTLPHILFETFWNSIQPEESLLTSEESFNSNQSFYL